MTRDLEPHAEPAPAPKAAAAAMAEPHTYDLEALALAADGERAYDESRHERVTQGDIARLLERRKRRP